MEAATAFPKVFLTGTEKPLFHTAKASSSAPLPSARTVPSVQTVRTARAAPVRAAASSTIATAGTLQCPPELRKIIDDNIDRCLTKTDLEKAIGDLRNKREGKVGGAPQEPCVPKHCARFTALCALYSTVCTSQYCMHSTALYAFHSTLCPSHEQDGWFDSRQDCNALLSTVLCFTALHLNPGLLLMFGV